MIRDKVETLQTDDGTFNKGMLNQLQPEALNFMVKNLKVNPFVV